MTNLKGPAQGPGLSYITCETVPPWSDSHAPLEDHPVCTHREPATLVSWISQVRDFSLVVVRDSMISKGTARMISASSLDMIFMIIGGRCHTEDIEQ